MTAKKEDKAGEYKVGKEVENTQDVIALIKIEAVLPFFMLDEAVEIIADANDDIHDGLLKIVAVNQLDQSQNEAENVLQKRRWKD